MNSTARIPCGFSFVCKGNIYEAAKRERRKEIVFDKSRPRDIMVSLRVRVDFYEKL